MAAIEYEGLGRKYLVTRVDGRDQSGQKHFQCVVFVLDLTHDPAARIAALTYANRVEETRPKLARDLRLKVLHIEKGLDRPGHERAGTAYDPKAVGHERLGRDSKPQD